MRRLKVLYLAQHLTMGGAEELLRGIATGLPPERFEVVVGCLTREGVIAGELRRAGVRVELLAGEPGPRDPMAFWRLLDFVRAERPDIVHTFLLNAGLYGRLAAWVAGVPAIFHAEQNVYFRRSRRHLALERFLAGRTTRVVACCRAVGEHYRQQVGLEAGRLEVIYNAVDFDGVMPRGERAAARAALGLAPDDIAIGCVGRLTEQKGQDVLLEALSMFEPSSVRRRLRVLLAGQGAWEGRIREKAAELGLLEQVYFLGVRRDRETLYGALDVFALPSRWEGLSLALVEAAGVGLPIVATDVGGNTEVVGGLAGAWLVAPEQPAALAGALSAAAALAGHVSHFHRPGVHERFGLERHLQQLERSYRAALGEPLEAEGEAPSNGSGDPQRDGELEVARRPASPVGGADDA